MSRGLLSFVKKISHVEFCEKKLVKSSFRRVVNFVKNTRVVKRFFLFVFSSSFGMAILHVLNCGIYSKGCRQDYCIDHFSHVKIIVFDLRNLILYICLSWNIGFKLSSSRSCIFIWFYFEEPIILHFNPKGIVKIWLRFFWLIRPLLHLSRIF